jgi:preprotein translocase subunit YajC
VELVLPLLLVGLMYVALIRPQQKRAKAQAELRNSIEVGDEIVTSGGMYGIVSALDDDDCWLEVADGIDIRFARGAVLRVSRRAGDLHAANDDDGAVSEEPVAPTLPSPAAGDPAAGDSVDGDKDSK